MIRKLHFLYLVLFSAYLPAAAQSNSLLPDQNPNFEISRTKYMQMADSINKWHATTQQNTYSAPDWYERKIESRNQRRAFRRELRLERARNNSYYNYPNYGYDNSWGGGGRWGNRLLYPIYDITLPLLLYSWWR